MKPTRVEIVKARTLGVSGYAYLGRGSALGNPYRVGIEVPTAAEAVDRFRADFYGDQADRWHAAARALLTRVWPGGVVRIGCPCNGTSKGEPCHASVIAQYLESQL